MFEVIGMLFCGLVGFILLCGVFSYIHTIFTSKSKLLSEIEYLQTENANLRTELFMWSKDGDVFTRNTNV